MRLTGWWSRRSNPEKVELYTRWSFHLFALAEVGSIGMGAAVTAPAPWGGWLLLAVAGHAGLGLVVFARALDWALGRRPRPDRLFAGYGLLSAAVAVGALVLDGVGVIDRHAAGPVAAGVTAFTVGALTMGARRVRVMIAVTLGTAGGLGAVAAACRMPLESVVAGTVSAAVLGLAMVFVTAFSAWLLRSMWELDASRELQARLAVAEERLRFGRDLHDVMGRNLSVLALKSELAVQLGRRGQTEAALAQMTEVQELAQESQREVRAVVRGYREADLHTEVEGARGVLAAAGIDCAVRVPAADALPPGVQSALGWVVREAATNVLRHGDARRCWVTLTEEEGAAVLVVEDDGPGRPGASAGDTGRGGGSGLAGLRERLAALDGVLTAGVVDGGRFRVTASVPAGEPAAGATGAVAAGARPAAGGAA
ncbi:histidine kinase [Streptomyces sp. ODS05-4]|uniref:sensor histidine kinase n=1 Tax=Streptomyces sp. ODS05-4 TaxID=2944939 RepID=UPI00210C4271|nr:histidine kinase [Streptomyces sp. ODS05-4]